MKSPNFELTNILVPVDFSGPSEQVIKHAKFLAEQFHGKISLVHVVDYARVAGEFGEFGSGLTATPSLAEERLSALATRSGDPELFESLHVRAGRPFEEIGQVAREFNTDLIVISTHGLTGLGYILLGGTAERVLRHAPCPVLVVRSGDTFPPVFGRILVPVDFSPASLAGVRYALNLKSVLGSQVTVLHVMEPLGPMMHLAVDVPAHEKKLRESAKLRLQQLHHEVAEGPDAFETVFREGTPYHEIVGFAQRASFDLIVMASQGRGGLSDALLGSTAERVVRHADRPVLVVRAKTSSMA